MRFIVVLTIGWLAGCGAATEQMPLPTTKPVESPLFQQSLVAFVGDSLFANWKVGPPAYAASTLVEDVPNAMSFAAPGRTTQVMRDQFAQVLASHPTIVVILGGANDLRTEESPTIDSIVWMAAQATQAGARVVICTVPLAEWWPGSDYLTPENTQETVRQWNAQLGALAAAYGYTLVDFYTPMLNQAATGPNGELFNPAPELEPNAQGYDVMWAQLYPALI